MMYTLTRFSNRSDGIFGVLSDQKGEFVCMTLEHAYLSETIPGAFSAAVPSGEYQCKRRLSPHFGYDLFILENVPGHDFIEIHIGNYNKDSHGCILLGMQMGNQLNGGKMLIDSKNAFDYFMKKMEGVDEFTLKVD